MRLDEKETSGVKADAGKLRGATRIEMVKTPSLRPRREQTCSTRMAMRRAGGNDRGLIYRFFRP
jgi:hypothetical protein